MRKWTKKVQKILGALAIAVLLIVDSGFISLAADTNPITDVIEVEILEAKIMEEVDWPSDIIPYTMLSDCTIGVTCNSEGMHIGISTGAVGTASVVGVKDVKIWKKVSGSWSLVATSSGGESYNRSTCAISILYSNAVKGATYKITCVHYGDVNGYIEGENDSGEFVFTY